MAGLISILLCPRCVCRRWQGVLLQEERSARGFEPRQVHVHAFDLRPV